MFVDPEPTNCNAEPSVLWIWKLFGQCVESNIEMVGFYLGLLSIGCWMCAAIPQLIINCRTGSVDQALSVYFLLFWLLGDTCNLVGAVLADQLPLQIFTGIYYVCMDLVMLSQFFYLSSNGFGDRRRRVLQGAQACAFFMPFTAAQYYDGFQFSGNRGRLGYTLGVISCIFYMASRIPQIVKNFRRGSTEGVAGLMFLVAICGNIFYGSSVIMSKHADVSWSDYLTEHLPWLVGSFGTVGLDTMLFLQCMCMGENEGYVSLADGDGQDDSILEDD